MDRVGDGGEIEREIGEREWVLVFEGMEDSVDRMGVVRCEGCLAGWIHMTLIAMACALGAWA